MIAVLVFAKNNYTYQIVDTDYTSYAVLYMCGINPYKSDKYDSNIIILSRTTTISSAASTAAAAVVIAQFPTFN